MGMFIASLMPIVGVVAILTLLPGEEAQTEH
jgi:hypothetical protein